MNFMATSVPDPVQMAARPTAVTWLPSARSTSRAWCRDGNDRHAEPAALGGGPCDGGLTRGGALGVGNVPDRVGNGLVGCCRVGGEAGEAPPPVAGGERGGIDGAGEEAPAERRVGDKPCSELAGDVRDGGLLATPRS